MNKIEKTQSIRLIDIFFLGPVMVIASRYTMPPVIRYTLLVGGIATVIYNGNNYLKQREKL